MKDTIEIRVLYSNNEVCYHQVCESAMTMHRKFDDTVFDVANWLEDDTNARVTMRVVLAWGGFIFRECIITSQGYPKQVTREYWG